MAERRAEPAPPARFGTPEVRGHYAALAPGYAAGANAACARAYAQLALRTLADCARVLEVGAGSSPVLDRLPAILKVECDLSLPMLANGRRPPSRLRVASDASCLPFPDASLDGFVAINLLEHLPDPSALFREAARVLSPAGRFLAVTPNGDAEWLLDLLERLRMKLPEGPHRFVRFRELADLAGGELRTLEHRRFLALPVGPPRLVATIDRLLAGRRGRGLFQFILCEKAERAPVGCP